MKYPKRTGRSLTEQELASMRAHGPIISTRLFIESIRAEDRPHIGTVGGWCLKEWLPAVQMERRWFIKTDELGGWRFPRNGNPTSRPRRSTNERGA